MMTLSRRVLKFLFPGEEKTRMEMRDARNRACASAEDLTRTIVVDGEKIQQMIQNRKVHVKHK
jgi:hypothetical protein